MLATYIHLIKKKKKKPSTLTQQKWHIWFISFNFALFPSNKIYQLSKMTQLTKTFTTCAAQLSQITLLFLVRAQVGLMWEFFIYNREKYQEPKVQKPEDHKASAISPKSTGNYNSQLMLEKYWVRGKRFMFPEAYHGDSRPKSSATPWDLP